MAAKKQRSIVLERVKIGHMVEKGRCIAHADGLAIFVSQVAPGDVVDLRIVRKKKNHAEAVPVYIHEYGASRTTPFCEHFSVCGGCQWQHVTYAAQLAAKEQLVRDKLTHLGSFSNPPLAPIIGAVETRYYRNKLEFTCASKRWISTEEIQSGDSLDRNAVGFHKTGRFDKVVEVQHCYLQPDPSNDIRNALSSFAKQHQLSFYDFYKHQGLLRNLIVRTASTGEVMVVVQFGEDAQDAIKQVMQHLHEQFPTLTSLQYVVNTKQNETFYDLPLQVYAGCDHIIEQLDGLKFRIGPKSFFQTNTAQAEVLYRKIRDIAQLQGDELLYDLYTGVGSIGLYLAQYVRHVVGLEVTEEAIVDAKRNAILNGLTNATFVAGEVEALLDDDFFEKHGMPDIIVTDPPRAGMHPRVIQRLLQVAPSRIVYVSCNPATQARDLALLSEKYRLDTVQPIDLFPHTSHVESIALLTR